MDYYHDGAIFPHLTQAANTVVYDQSDGIFGELLDAPTVLASSLPSSSSSAAAAQNTVPSGSNLLEDQSAQRQQLRSVQYGYPDNRSPSTDIPVRFYNYSSSFVRIRWVDAQGIDNNNAPPDHNHTWTLAPNEELGQRTTAGHVFVLSVILMSNGEADQRGLFGTNESREAVLGAFRPKRSLPSGSHHSVQVHHGDVSVHSEHDGNSICSFILEVVLSDKTCYDALVVASYWLDREIISKQIREDAVKTLHKIISNIIKDPTNKKYRKLRLSNGFISKNIGRHWSAMEFLRVLGFRKQKMINDQPGDQPGDREEEYLIAENVPDDSELSIHKRGVNLLEQVHSRCQPGFLADLAPPTPWDEPVILDHGGGRDANGGRWGNAGSTHFITPEDRWARADRARRFRGRAGPRPSPGNAPSDRGRWGR
mmetsp:Transcript_12903/g.27829  ORF Transcript_12903/g.27829 Transcript_12903/m.27829 type:complete len:424 (+) Transcript_12903:27-1298(+)